MGKYTNKQKQEVVNDVVLPESLPMLESPFDIKEVEFEVKAEPIMYGVATTNLIVDNKAIEKGEQVSIFEDNGDEWLTCRGSVSKLYLLLKKV